MRILHTSDWHLGRQFHNVSLIDDQAFALERLVRIALEQRVDVVVVAGDIFDRSVPPAAATTLLDDVLHRLAAEAGVPVILTSGNHDGAERLAFGARALAASGIHIRSRFDFEPVVLTDAHGAVRFHCLPYADPAVVGDHLGRSIASHDAAMAALVGEVRRRMDAAARDVLIAHCFVAGGAARESERPLTVGGAEAVSAAHFADFDYVALGHLHGAQAFAGGRVRYPGSLLKYSFSEANDVKGVLVIDLDAGGEVKASPAALEPRRDVRVIEGILREIVAAGADDPRGDDYILVRLADTHAILDVMAKLRAVYPNVLHVERPVFEQAAGRMRPAADRRHTGQLPMFADFWEQVTGEPLDEKARAVVASALDAARRDAEG